MNSKTERKNNKFKNIFDFRFFAYDFLKWTAAIPTLIALRPRAYFMSKKARKPIKGANIIIANHESYIDPVNLHMAIWYRRLHIMATQELFSTPKSKKFFNAMQCIPVNKENFNYNTFKQVKYWLEKDALVTIFPEGTVNRDKELTNTFHSGVALMASRCKVPIIPIYFRRREKWYQRLRYVIGEPIYTEDYYKGIPKIDDFDRIAGILHEKELEMKEFLDDKMN